MNTKLDLLFFWINVTMSIISSCALFLYLAISVICQEHTAEGVAFPGQWGWTFILKNLSMNILYLYLSISAF